MQPRRTLVRVIIVAGMALVIAVISAFVGAGPLPGASPVAAATPCGSGPGLGDRILSVQSDEDVWVEILDNDATFIDRISLVAPYEKEIGWAARTGVLRAGGTRYHPNGVGTRVNLGKFPVGTELVFRVDVKRPTQIDIDADEIPDNLGGLPREYQVWSGPGSGNTVDGAPHAIVEQLGGGVVRVRYEDSLTQDPRNDYNYCNAAIKVELGVPNFAPRISASSASVAVDEGQHAATSGTYADDNVGDNVGIAASSGSVIKTGTSNGAWTWSFETVDGPAQTRPVTITADDGRGGRADTTFQLTVRNVPPSVATPLIIPEPSDEGGGVSATADFSDPAGLYDAPYTCTVNFGDGSADEPGMVEGTTCIAPGHAYPDNLPGDAPYTISFSVTDKDGGTGTNSAPHVVRNVAPQIDARLIDINGGPGIIREGLSVFLVADVFEPGFDAVAVTLDWGDGSPPVELTPDSSVSSGSGTYTRYNASRLYPDDNPTGTPIDVYTVTFTATDEEGGSASYTTTVTVFNVDPESTGVGPWPGTLHSLADGPVDLLATFRDRGVQDSFTCAISWGDGATGAGTVELFGGQGFHRECRASHAFTVPGVYTIGVTVIDDDGGSYTDSTFIVVYDPNGGFVTGGGFIDSPPGAYKPDPTASGKANFGFVARYQKGATVPNGQTEFQFKAGDLNLHSERYEYLVVAGAKAQFKGMGTVNGETGYRFILTVTDGQLPGGGGVDEFRIRIWAPDGGLIYDNGTELSENIELSNEQGISGGSIVIHK